MARAATTTDRGYYFDFVEFQKNHEKNNTPSTPAIPHIYALKERVDHMLAEGLSNRYQRHEETNALLQEWAAGHGFENLAPEGFRSKSLGCFKTPDNLDLSGWIKAVRNNHGFLINGGYGKIKGTTFRISNMGNETPETMKELFTALDKELPQFLR